MSDHMFGVSRDILKASEIRRRDRICREEGGYGYCQIDESHGTASGGRWLGWFSGPSKGAPFDDGLARRVLARCQGAKDHE